MSTFFREYRVHHSTADGILVQLPDAGGFGRATKATLGDDLLAERLVRSFSSREHIPAILQRKRDSQGYRLLTVNILEGYSDLMTYPIPVRRLVPLLLRKHLLIGLGTTTAARLLRSSPKGSVFSIPPNMTAMAAFEQVEKQRSGTAALMASEEEEHLLDGETSDAVRRNGEAVEVRLLNYDVKNDIVHVTAKAAAVESTPVDTAISAAALSTIDAGDVVSCTVLLSSTDDDCAVVLVPIAATAETPACTVLGYYLYRWTDSRNAESVALPVVGHVLDLTIEFCPTTPQLKELLPFIVLSSRGTAFQTLPTSRRMETPMTVITAASSSSAAAASSENGAAAEARHGLLGYFPWRETYAAASAGGGGADDDEGNSDADGESKTEHLQRTRRRKLEEAIDAYERGMESAIPTSPEEFQRLLLATPNSSYLWTQYMAHHVRLQEYEAARQVAERALETIGVREHKERLNVWVAYLNVENLYGTEESMASIFRRAQQYHLLNPLELYERLADIYAASRKPNQLLAVCRVMTNKFKSERRTWERLGVVLVDQGKRDQLKRMLKDMGDVLRRDAATLAVVHIAIHEYKHGSPENGRALFESLLSKTPKRSDVWSTYIDQELGLLTRHDPTASVLQVRQIFQRGVAMSFAAKVMQQLLTRFLSFEKLHGTPVDVAAVKERARTYVETKIQAVTDTGAA